MRKEKELITHNRLVLLFTTFVISTICLGVHYLFKIQGNQLLIILDRIIFYLGFFGYITVVSILFFNYGAGAFKWISKDNKRLIIVTVIILGLGYSLFDGLNEESWLVFFRDICMAGLVIIGLPFVDKIISRIKNVKVWNK